MAAGLDHIPIAVKDLDAAAERYRALGFVLKPGRPHANGIRNQHAKFRDGTELELITAPDARDDLTARYRRHLSHGDGPAFLALYGPSLDAVARELAPPYIFFGALNHSPTDREEHFAHANGAESLIGVWLAGDDLWRERQLLARMGATIARREIHAPEALTTDVAQVADDVFVLLPEQRQLVPGRRIVGATIRVKSLAAAHAVLSAVSSAPLPTIASRGGSSVFLPPTLTHGLWLELREMR
jgi:catechol 2,3-dioxygenase-like lactoylglutathione lyase family enzyme